MILKIGPDYLNMAHFVHARFDGKGAVEVMFLAPAPSSVGASSWSVEPYTVVFRGADADAVRAFLENRPLPIREGGGS